MNKKELAEMAFDRFIAGAKSDTARDYWFAKFKQEQTQLDLDKLESKLDAALNSETPESLTEWIESKRNNITSVEWLENKLADNLKLIIINQDYELMEDLFEQANGMNQQEIVTAYQQGCMGGYTHPHFGSGLNYFRETYNK
jgi:hypothetical protein